MTDLVADALIERFAYTNYGTFGVHSFPRFPEFGKLWTIEDPWLNNLPDRSCVPEALYQLVEHVSQHHPAPILAMVNPQFGIFHYKPPNPPPGARDVCLYLHPGNTTDDEHPDAPTDDVDGCVAAGLLLGVPDGRWGVSRSVDAVTRWKEQVVQVKPKTLEIRFNKNAGLYAMRE